MKNLTLVIPAKYEKESLPLVLDELEKFNLKILVVLEEQDKETIDSIKNYNCEILFQKKQGYGNALIEGINNTNTEFFCIFNADGSFNPSELKNMYFLAETKKFDLIFGTRYEKGSKSEDDTITTFIGNKIFSFIGKIFFSLPISDILYTFVLGNTKKVKDLKLEKKDFSFCVELPIKAKRSNLQLTTNLSFERRRIGGKKKVNAIRDGFKILISMIVLFFNY
tara:strand:+ start:19 stop:687 length:669 start_codon:yes stop_codon:yes gene_type:complete